MPRIQLVRITVGRTQTALLGIQTSRFYMGTWAHRGYSTTYFPVYRESRLVTLQVRYELRCIPSHLHSPMQTP